MYDPHASFAYMPQLSWSPLDLADYVVFASGGQSNDHVLDVLAAGRSFVAEVILWCHIDGALLHRPGKPSLSSPRSLFLG